MTTSTIDPIERARQLQSKADASLDERWERLVHRLANGDNITAEELSSVCRAEKDYERLRSDVRGRERLRVLRSEARTLADRRAENTRAREAVRLKDEETEAAIKGLLHERNLVRQIMRDAAVLESNARSAEMRSLDLLPRGLGRRVSICRDANSKAMSLVEVCEAKIEELGDKAKRDSKISGLKSRIKSAERSQSRTGSFEPTANDVQGSKDREKSLKAELKREKARDIKAELKAAESELKKAKRALTPRARELDAVMREVDAL